MMGRDDEMNTGLQRSFKASWERMMGELGLVDCSVDANHINTNIPTQDQGQVLDKPSSDLTDEVLQEIELQCQNQRLYLDLFNT